MKPKYKIGDIVTIKKKRDGDGNDYRFCFTDTMLRDYGGKSYEIINIRIADISSAEIIPDDGYRYYLKDASFTWASSMFEEDSSEALISEDSIIDNSLDAFIAKKKCPELDFTL